MSPRSRIRRPGCLLHVFAALLPLLIAGCGGGGGGGGTGGGGGLTPPAPPAPPGYGYFWWFVPQGPFPGTEVEMPGQLLRFTAEQAAAALPEDGSDRLYVADALNDVVTVIDTSLRATINEIAVGRRPISLLPSADGARLYVVNRDSQSVSIIDTAAQAVVGNVALAFEPYHATISRDGARLVITHRFSRRVSIVDTAAASVLAALEVGVQPVAAALTLDDDKAYVANQADNTVSIVDMTTNTVAATAIAVGNEPSALLVNYAGNRLFVANRGSDSVTVIDTSTDTVTGGALAVGPGPAALALTSDDAVLFTANSHTSSSEQFGCARDQANQPSFGNTLTAVDAQALTVINASISVAEAPVGLAVLSDNSVAYSISSCVPELSEVGVPGFAVNAIAMPDRSTAIALGPDDVELYVIHPESISFVNTASRAVATIPARGTGPYQVDFLDGENQVIATRPGDNSVAILDRTAGTLVAEIGSLNRPSGIAASQSANLAVVANAGIPLAAGEELSVLQSAALAASLDVPPGPVHVTVSESAQLAVSANFGDLVPVKPSEPTRPGFGNTVSIVDLTDPLANPPQTLEVSFAETAGTLRTAVIEAGGITFVAATNFTDSEITFINLQNQNQTRVDNLGRGPTIIGGDPQLPYALVLTQGDPEEYFLPPVAGTLEIIDPLNAASFCTAPACRSVAVGLLPSALAIARGIGGIPDRVLVANYSDDTISIFDLDELIADPALAEQNRIDLPVPPGPASIAVADDGSMAWIGSYTDWSVSEVQLPADDASIALGATVSVGAPVTDVRFEPAGQEVWASTPFLNQLTVIQNGAVLRTVTLPD